MGAHLIGHFIDLIEEPISKDSHILRRWGLGFAHVDLGAIQFSPSHCVIESPNVRCTTLRLSQSQTRHDSDPHFQKVVSPPSVS